GPRVTEGGVELDQRRHQRLGHEAAAVVAEAPGRVGLAHHRLAGCAHGFGHGRHGSAAPPAARIGFRHRRAQSPASAQSKGPFPSGWYGRGAAARALRTKRWTLSGSLRVGSPSAWTPVEVSTPQGCTSATAAATLSGVSPPARIIRRPTGTPSARAQSNTLPEPGTGESSSRASAP